MRYWILWLFLFISVIFGVAGMSLMKGLEQTCPWAGLLAMYALLGLAYYFRAKAVMRIPVAVAYAVWEAAGLAIIIVVGVILFQEYFGWMRMLGLGFLLGGAWLIHYGTESGTGKGASCGAGSGNNTEAFPGGGL